MYDYGIVGAGIIGLTLAYQLKEKYPECNILILEKEGDVAFHASGRNSGVLHAGFYYTADSLKAKFCVEGNARMKQFCTEHNIPINSCGKLVVATNEEERLQLHELHKRAQINGVDVKLISDEEAKEIDPNVFTYKEALWSPNTASVNPKIVCNTLKELLITSGVEFRFSEKYRSFCKTTLTTDKQTYSVRHMINVAGSYADKIAQQFGLAKHLTMLPFKGFYVGCKTSDLVKTHVYPVPNLKYPFLGVHYTLTAEGGLKIGPTAVPALWREQYNGLRRFSFKECIEIAFLETKLFFTNAFNFRALAIEEMKKYRRTYMVQLAQKMVYRSTENDFGDYKPPGIRSQLVDKKTNKLVQDFIIERFENTTHVLNLVSPGFTCSFAFSNYVLEHYLEGSIDIVNRKT